ncbi:MAG: SAP domain-containing protein [Deltaproteobacteria bacterium]|nr:SAP domain-containing protein [Deltaproteobacteria bacterium]
MGAMDVKNSFLDITELVRSIQRSEGNPDCFLKAEGLCDRTDCVWRQYCLETGKGKKRESDRKEVAWKGS